MQAKQHVLLKVGWLQKHNKQPKQLTRRPSTGWSMGAKKYQQQKLTSSAFAAAQAAPASIHHQHSQSLLLQPSRQPLR